jgi:tetratricopeptide (TPR) repeat protein
MPSFITFMLTAGFIMMIWEKFERPTAETGPHAAHASSPAADNIAQARAAYERGCALMQGGDPQGAIRELELAISLDPTDDYAFIARGNAYAYLQQFERAMADYDHALTLDPASAPAYYNRGRTWQDIGDLDRATADLDAAIRLRPAYLTALHARGIALQALGKNAPAIADFRQALALANDDATRQQLLAKLATLGAYP